jgi:hypothetical protein
MLVQRIPKTEQHLDERCQPFGLQVTVHALMWQYCHTEAHPDSNGSCKHAIAPARARALTIAAAACWLQTPMLGYGCSALTCSTTLRTLSIGWPHYTGGYVKEGCICMAHDSQKCAPTSAGLAYRCMPEHTRTPVTNSCRLRAPPPLHSHQHANAARAPGTELTTSICTALCPAMHTIW